MQVFERDGKVNFVDENNVLLGYDTNQNCCERADWFIADYPMSAEPETKRESIPDLKGFVFDIAFYKYVDGGEFDGGGMAIFHIVNGDTEKFVHIFNAHNGYYTHGFDFTIIGGKTIREGIL
jgi:hypothetical protein